MENSFDHNLSILNPIFNQLLNLAANQKPNLDVHITELINFIKLNTNKVEWQKFDFNFLS